MNIIAIIQARRGSTRLADKIFLDLVGKPLIEHVVFRLKNSKKLDKIVIATTTKLEDDKLELWAKNNGIDVFRGDELNVLNRYYYAAVKFSADIIVRITADDPFKDYRLVDQAIDILLKEKLEFVCNNSPVSFPEGLDVEVFTMEVLTKSFEEANTDFQKEHVTQYVHQNKHKFKFFNFLSKENFSHYRWTLDTEDDYIFVKEIYENLYSVNKKFLTEDIYKLIEQNPTLLKINSNVKRSDLYK
jgi:spore coat polysaccharide biosynthesis protein SpsF